MSEPLRPTAFEPVPPPPSLPPRVHETGLVQQLKDVRENAFGGYHDYPVGEGAIIDRQALTEAKFAKKVLGKGYGGLVGKLGDTEVDRGGVSVHVFDDENIKQLARGYQSVGTDGGYPDHDTWKESALDSMINDEDLTFKNEQAKLIKRAEVGTRIEQLQESGLLGGSEESVEALASAVEDYQDASNAIDHARTKHRENGVLKRAATTSTKLAKDVVTLAPLMKGVVAAQAWASTKKSAADPEKLAKTRGIANLVGLFATTAYLGYRTARGLGSDNFVEGFLPFGSDGNNKTGVAYASTEVGGATGTAGKPSAGASPSIANSPSASPSISPSASESPSPSASASASAGASPNTSPSPSTGGEVIVPGEEEVPPKKQPEELIPDAEGEGEVLPTTVAYESDLGKFERDESGKYWKGTLEWKMREAAEAQGLELTDRQIGTATHRMMQEQGISYDEARRMPDNYHVKWTEEQLDKYFDGFDVDAKEGDKPGGTETDTDTDTEEKKEGDKPDKTDDKELTDEEKKAKEQDEYERRKHLEGLDEGEQSTDLGDPRLEYERRKLLGDDAVPVATGTTSASPVTSASASPEAQTETGGGAGTAVAIGAAVAGVTAAGLLTAKAIRKGRKGKPAETSTDDDEVDLSGKRDAEARTVDDDEPLVPLRRPIPDEDDLPAFKPTTRS